MNIYRDAWEHLRDTIATKTSWGRNELATAMAEALEYAVQVAEEREELSGIRRSAQDRESAQDRAMLLLAEQDIPFKDGDDALRILRLQQEKP